MEKKFPYLDKITNRGLVAYTVSLSKIWAITFFSSLQHLISVSMPFLFIFIMSQLWFVHHSYIYIEFCLGFIIISVIWCTCSYIKDKLFYTLLFEHSYNISHESVSLLTNLPYASVANLPIESQFVRFIPLENLSELWFEKIIKPLSDLPLVIFSYALTCYFLGFLYFTYIASIITIVIIIMHYKPVKDSSNITESEFLGTINDSFSNLNLIKSHNRSNYFINKNKELIYKKYTTNYIVNTKQNIITIINESILLLIYLGTLAFSVYHAVSGDLGIKHLVGVIILTWFSISPLKQVLNVIGEVPKAKELLRQFQNMMKVNQVKNRHKQLKLDDNFNGNISINNAAISYGQGSGFKMQNINITAQKGEVLFLYGLSGSGKSTLLKLWAGLIKQTSGSVIIGHDTNLLDQNSLSKTIILVSDDSYFKNSTIENNLALSPHDMNQEQLSNFISNLNIKQNSENNLIKNYNLYEFKNFNSKKLPYNKIINNILLEKIPSNICNKIILLDEPLFAPDETSLQQLATIINKIKANNTIVIASRYDIYAPLADNIILLNNGRIENKWVKNEPGQQTTN